MDEKADRKAARAVPSETPLVPRDADFEARCRASFARQGFMTLIGAEMISLSPGHCAIAIAAKPELCQQRGFLHGGVTAAIADSAAGYAAYTLMPAGSTPLTVEFKINLLAPAIGERFVAIGKVVRSGKTLSVVEVEVTAQAGDTVKPIARSLGTLMCIENTSDGPAPQGASS
jgi:uncharacterized protein (TIGR00369 family)